MKVLVPEKEEEDLARTPSEDTGSTLRTPWKTLPDSLVGARQPLRRDKKSLRDSLKRERNGPCKDWKTSQGLPEKGTNFLAHLPEKPLLTPWLELAGPRRRDAKSLQDSLKRERNGLRNSPMGLPDSLARARASLTTDGRASRKLPQNGQNAFLFTWLGCRLCVSKAQRKCFRDFTGAGTA